MGSSGPNERQQRGNSTKGAASAVRDPEKGTQKRIYVFFFFGLCFFESETTGRKRSRQEAAAQKVVRILRDGREELCGREGAKDGLMNSMHWRWRA